MLDFIKSPINLNGRTEDEIINIGYRPDDGGLGDCCFASDESGFHCFYIARMYNAIADCADPFQEISIGHGAGENIFSMTKAADAVHIRENRCDNGHVWAPSIVYYKNIWHMFYTAVSDKLYQTIAVAHSNDLYNWTADENNIVIDCKNCGWAQYITEGYTSCRDPYVVNFDGAWYCYYTVQLKNGNAGIGVCASPDLISWENLGVCLERTPRNGETGGTYMCESPCVFRKNGVYYALYNQGMGIKYAVSDNPADFKDSAVRTLYNSTEIKSVPYNFEILNTDTGLFGYLIGGYFSQLRYGYCDINSINNGEITFRKINFGQ